MRDRSGANTDPRWIAVAAAPLFCVLAIANSAGYRYGVSDLSFYLPAAFQHVDPVLFPRDGALLAVQAGLTLNDELLGAALRTGGAAGLSAPAVLYGLHLLTLLLLFLAALSLGRALFQSGWSTAALAAALTLRHAVPQSGVNTLEGYFQPRVLAFAICALAIALFLRRGAWPALALVGIAGAVHPTTALWFAVLLGVAGLVSETRQRAALLALAALAAVSAAWALTGGPLAGRLVRMDQAWLSVLADRRYLFADRWPSYVWGTYAVYVVLIAAAAITRRRRGRLAAREAALGAGAGALVLTFVALLPLISARVVLAIQLQPARLFWILDLLAIVSVIWLVERGAERGRIRATMILAWTLVLFSLARGIYLMTIEFPERSIAQIAEPATPWGDAMRWAESATPAGSHWLAHPNHAFLYGTSVRVSGRRDVFHEASKDPAVAMYDRGVAMRVRERAAEVGDFDTLTAPQALALARRYHLDFLITDRPLPLPLAYRNARFNVYRLSE